MRPLCHCWIVQFLQKRVLFYSNSFYFIGKPFHTWNFCLWYKNTNHSFRSECEYFLSSILSSWIIFIILYYYNLSLMLPCIDIAHDEQDIVVVLDCLVDCLAGRSEIT